MKGEIKEVIDRLQDTINADHASKDMPDGQIAEEWLAARDLDAEELIAFSEKQAVAALLLLTLAGIDIQELLGSVARAGFHVGFETAARRYASEQPS